MVKVIAFDYDGVLVDSVQVGLEAYQAIADRFGSPRLETVEDFKQIHIIPHTEIYEMWGLSTDMYEDASAVFYETLQKLQDNITLIPGMIKTLQALAHDYKLVVVSGNKASIIDDQLRKVGIRHFFNFIIGAEHVEKIKPYPDGLQLCLTRCGIQKNELLFIGDMVSDITMGKNADVKTIIVHGHSWNPKEALINAQPDVLVETPEQIITAIMHHD